jgi:hypothetical protein
MRDAVLTAVYFINRMSSRVLDWKSPTEMLKGKNKNILPLKIFGCICFVQNNKLNVEKLNPKAMKYIFVGYSGTQKSMHASPVKNSLFVSMNVTF